MKLSILLLCCVLMGCTNPVEDCVDKKQDAWREANPKADYAKASSANERFREQCQRMAK
jgi:hypothetical protein